MGKSSNEPKISPAKCILYGLLCQEIHGIALAWFISMIAPDSGLRGPIFGANQLIFHWG